jgi:hypothetical protein
MKGSQNLKVIVDRLFQKDKLYNLCVRSVAEKQNKTDALNKDIKALEEEYTKLKINCNIILLIY